MNARIHRGLAWIVVAALAGVAGCAASDGSGQPTARAGKSPPGKRAPGKPGPGKRVPGKSGPGKHMPCEPVIGTRTPRRPPPARNLPVEVTPGKTRPAEPTPGQPTPGKCAEAEPTGEIAAACSAVDALDTAATEALLDPAEAWCAEDTDGDDSDAGEP